MKGRILHIIKYQLIKIYFIVTFDNKIQTHVNSKYLSISHGEFHCTLIFHN
ncbi:hypothetical protein XSR1_150026 [Xenorhabdus szentirmaii DSM 16338]|uniref:Uncharacterized protein n=1 Tax=Xenorhabdus szentirmaii DSM 16338 TaxID=1427518 RepID=W1IWS2_9GAMM|nr:hypothetical protein Xsze_01626 [Xenorhabdus szentirmaii DSM 16338]CDL81675.1 hypothetical protein XSR1_150026 [Xenorhabdus szentirmaii DSM 16338]